MKVALYARESSDDTTNAPPITSQLERGRQWAIENGHEIVIEYPDNGYSGGDWKRPAWNKSVNDAKRHFFQILWVWNQDRLARDTEQFLWYYRNLRDAKTRIYEDTSSDFIDMESLGGRVKHQSLAQASEIFRLVTGDKVKKAYERNKKQGKEWGRKRLIWDVEKAEILRSQGKGWREIGKEVNVSYQTVRRVLLNRVIK
jgi:site-specific DNA recombinase